MRPASLLRLPRPDRPDGELLAAFAADRDEAAFAELVRRHGPLVWGVCRRALANPADAEDAFQAAFLVLVRRADRLTAADTVGPWLHRVAVLTARDLRKKAARRAARLSPLPPDLPAPPVPNSDIDDLLLGLPDRDRAAVVLCCLGGLTQREAAGRLGVPEGTLSARLSRGLAKLRRRFAGGLPAVAVVPPALSAAAVRAATTVHLAAAVSPGVLDLTRGVMRMFWLKKAAAASASVGVLVAAGAAVVLIDRGPAPVAAAAPAPPADEPTDAISRLLRLDAETDRLTKANATAADLAAVAARRKAALLAVDPKNRRPEAVVLIAVGKGGLALHEYDADGHLVASAASASPGFVERYLARGAKTNSGPHIPAVHVAADAHPDTVARTFESLTRAGVYWGRLTASLPDNSGKTGVEKPSPGGEVRYAPGRVTYVEVMVNFHRLDDDGRPERILFDARC